MFKYVVPYVRVETIFEGLFPPGLTHVTVMLHFRDTLVVRKNMAEPFEHLLMLENVRVAS